MNYDPTKVLMPVVSKIFIISKLKLYWKVSNLLNREVGAVV